MSLLYGKNFSSEVDFFFRQTREKQEDMLKMKIEFYSFWDACDIILQTRKSHFPSLLKSQNKFPRFFWCSLQKKYKNFVYNPFQFLNNVKIFNFHARWFSSLFLSSSSNMKFDDKCYLFHLLHINWKKVYFTRVFSWRKTWKLNFHKIHSRTLVSSVLLNVLE